VWTVQFSPNDRRILTASDDNSARVWEIQNRAALALPLRHTSIVNTAEFSVDGKQIATASDDFTARVWDAADGRPLTDSGHHLARWRRDGLGRKNGQAFDRAART
jgi:WD40 repeat protein